MALDPSVYEKLKSAYNIAVEKENESIQESDVSKRLLRNKKEEILNENRYARSLSSEKGARADIAAAAMKSSIANKDYNDFNRRAKYQKDKVSQSYTGKELEKELKFLEKKLALEERILNKRKVGAAAELKLAQDNYKIIQARTGAEAKLEKAHTNNYKTLEKEKKMEEAKVRSQHQYSESIKNNIAKTEKFLRTQSSQPTLTSVGAILRDKFLEKSVNYETGGVNKGAAVGGIAGAAAADLALSIPGSAMGAARGGLHGGLSGLTSSLGDTFKNLTSTLGSASGAGIGTLIAPGAGTGIGAAVGKFIGDAAGDYTKTLMENSVKKVEWGAVSRKQAMTATRLADRFSTRNNVGLMLPGMSMGETQQAIESGNRFGIEGNKKSSTFMTLTALDRVWGDVSSQMRDMMHIYNDQAEAIGGVEKAFGYGRIAAKALGMDVSEAAKQFSTAGKMARFAGIDARFAGGTLDSISSRADARSYSTIGIDTTRLGEGVGALYSAPKKMSMAMQYYYASGMGADKNMNPLRASFMAQYGDPSKFGYNSNTGVASFSAGASPVFLRNMKRNQMNMIGDFTRAYGGDSSAGFAAAQKAMVDSGQMTKEQFDMLTRVDINKIGSQFSKDYEKVSKDPTGYLTKLTSIEAINQQIQVSVSKILDKMPGASTSDSFVNTLAQGLGFDFFKGYSTKEAAYIKSNPKKYAAKTVAKTVLDPLTSPISPGGVISWPLKKSFSKLETLYDAVHDVTKTSFKGDPKATAQEIRRHGFGWVLELFISDEAAGKLAAKPNPTRK